MESADTLAGGVPSENRGRSEQAAKAARAVHARLGESLPTVKATRCEKQQRRDRELGACL